jgi:predicted RNA-binding protein YlqC (UPF0109 family)
VSFSVHVDKTDYGYVVGKSGRNVRALRTLFYAMGKRYRTLFELVLEETAQ